MKVKEEKLNTVKIGKYSISEYKQDSVYIYKTDGEGGEFKIKTLEKLLDKFWRKEF